MDIKNIRGTAAVFTAVVLSFSLGVASGIVHENDRFKKEASAAMHIVSEELEHCSNSLKAYQESEKTAEKALSLPMPKKEQAPKKKPTCKLWSNKKGMMVNCNEGEAVK